MTSQRIASSSTRTGTWVTGASKRSRAHSIRSRRRKPKRLSGRHEIRISDLPDDGLVLGRGERDLGRAGVDAGAQLGEQLAAARDLVEERQDRPTARRLGLAACAGLGHVLVPAIVGSGSRTSASSPGMIACLAPGTPNS